MTTDSLADPGDGDTPSPEGDEGASIGRPKGYVLDNQIGFLIRRAQQRHLNIFSTYMGEDLTARQFAVLAKLKQIGACSQNALGRQTALDAATTNGVIRRLQERGLVEKVKSDEDLRLKLVRLTPEGDRTVTRMIPIAQDITAKTMAPLNREEQATLARLLRRLG